MNIREKKVERRKIWEKMKGVLDKAEEEKRELTAEEREQYDRMENEVDELLVKIEEAEADEERRARANALGDEMDESESDPIRPELDNRDVQTEKETRAYSRYLASTDPSSMNAALAELRAAVMDSDTSGGYMVAPQQFVARLIKDIDNSVFIRNLATTFTVPKAESLGAPSLDNDPADPVWTAEILTGDEDSTMSFGKRELYPHPLAKRIKVSKKLVRASALNIEQIVRQRLSYKASVVEENAFLNGSGANEPLGVFTASANGISTDRDVSTGNTGTAIGADNLIENKYNLKTGYWRNARWIFHRTAIKKIRKLKDGEGQYLWRPGLQNDRGDTILDIPVLMSEYAPSTFTTTLYVGIIGDFSYYWIATALDMTIQVLVELYAATNQNGYILRLASDGMPVLENAFSRVTLA